MLTIRYPGAQYSVVNFYQSDGKIVAKVYLDNLLQVQSVLLLPGITKEQRAFVIQLAATNVCKYVVRRVGATRIHDEAFDFNPSRRTEASSAKARGFMQATAIHPGLVNMDVDRLVSNLRLVGIPVAEAAYPTLEAALMAMLECIEPDRQGQVWFHGYDPKGREERGIVGVRFVSFMRPFTIWRQEEPRHPEHPVSELRYLVQGESCTLSHHPAITVYPPHEGTQQPKHFSELDPKQRRLSGDSLTLRVAATLALSGNFPRLLADIVQAGLSFNNAHMGVEGGFPRRRRRLGR